MLEGAHTEIERIVVLGSLSAEEWQLPKILLDAVLWKDLLVLNKCIGNEYRGRKWELGHFYLRYSGSIN